MCRRQHGLRFDPPLELLMQSFDRVRCPRAPPLAWRQSCEGEQPVAGFLQAVGDGTVLEPPFADEGLAARLDLLTRGRIDHVVIIRGDLVMQALWRVREKVPVLVDRAALNRHTIPHGGDRLVSPGAPSTMRNSGRRNPRLMRSSRTVRQASVLSPPMLLIASTTFWAVPTFYADWDMSVASACCLTGRTW